LLFAKIQKNFHLRRIARFFSTFAHTKRPWLPRGRRAAPPAGFGPVRVAVRQEGLAVGPPLRATAAA